MRYLKFGYDEKEVNALLKFDELVEELGSNNKACQSIGISSGTISEIKNGKYKGDKKKQFEKLYEYFEIKEKAKALNIDKDYIPTNISEIVKKHIELCQTRGRLSVLSGDAGIGKTRAIMDYCKQKPNSTTWITANPCMNTVKTVLREIAKKLNVQLKASNIDLYNAIISKLNDGQIIIIDEAQHISLKVIETLRGISDYFEDRGQTLGICFIGNKTTMNNFGFKEDAVFEQIVNRTFQMPILSTEQVQKSDIQMLFPAIEDEKAMEFILKIAKSRQAIRGAMNLYLNCKDNEDLSFDSLVAMAKEMHMNI